MRRLGFSAHTWISNGGGIRGRYITRLKPLLIEIKNQPRRSRIDGSFSLCASTIRVPLNARFLFWRRTVATTKGFLFQERGAKEWLLKLVVTKPLRALHLPVHERKWTKFCANSP